MSSAVASNINNVEEQYGTPKTVKTIVEVKSYLVEFYDADGKFNRDIVYRLGDSGPIVGTRQGPATCASMGGLNSWLESTLKSRLDAKRVLNVPKEDGVSVTDDAPIIVPAKKSHP